MGLSFLNKKIWHPGSFANIEKVWIAEQKQREREKKSIENSKKLKEERQIEELKKLQIEAGLVPSSHLERLDWMYQGPEVHSNNNMTTAEEFLVGKSLKEKAEEKKHFTPVFQESYSNPQNEVFTKVHEDPLFVIKREENRQRKEIEENPYKMKMLLKQVEEDVNKKKDKKSKKKKDKKDKKDKKHKKDKKDKHKRKDSSSDSDSAREQFETKLKITTPSYIAHKQSQTPQVYGLVDKEGKKITPSRNNLGPDDDLYRDRKQLLDREQELRRKQSGSSYKSLTEDEKEKLRQDMENKAHSLDRQRNNLIDDKIRHLEDTSRNSSNSGSRPKFLKSMEKEVYTSGKHNLEDRVKRNKYYMNKE